MLKKSMLFIVDKPNWAYEFMVKTWIPFLAAKYDCYIAYQQDFSVKPYEKKSFFHSFLYNILNFIRLKKAAISGKNQKFFFLDSNKKYFYPKYTKVPVYHMDRQLNKTLSLKQEFDFQVEMAFYFQYIAEFPFKAKNKLVGIFTDAFPHDGPNFDLKTGTDRNLLSRREFYEKYLKNYQHIIVGGGNLLKEYQKITDKVTFVYGIFGQNNFKENNDVGGKEGLTIGWTGTPKRPMKGFEQIILPAIEKVKQSGRKIHLKTKFSGPYEELYSFYEDIDLVVIASNADSGPSLYAEASLSKAPCISTKVGLPLMGIKDGINGLFTERNVDSLAEAIIKLYDDRKLLKSFSNRVKKDYLLWMDNKITVKYFENVLESIIN